MVYSTVESDDVDFAVSEADFEEAWPEFRDSWNNLDAILRVNRANTTYKKVTASVRRALEREPCVICFETHHAKQLTTTNCGHTFCRPCLSQHINTCYYDEKEISCPYCRNDKITLTRHKNKTLYDINTDKKLYPFLAVIFCSIRSIPCFHISLSFHL
jgi:hypothetical protein